MKLTRSNVRNGALVLGALVGGGALAETTACSSSKASTESTSSNNAPIVIGMSVSLTGGNAGVGAALRDGTQAAMSLINANGGVLGRQIQLDIRDDASNNSTSGDNGAILQGVINGFLEEKVTAILGPGASVQVAQAQALAFPQDPSGNPLPNTTPTVMISAWATSPKVTTIQKPGSARYLYRTAPSDVGQTKAMFKLMTESGSGMGAIPACKTPFLVYSADIIGNAFFKYLSQAFPTVGVSLLSATIPTDQVADYTSQIKSIIDAKSDCIAFAAYLEGVTAMLPALQTAIAALPSYPKHYFIGTDAVKDQSFLDKLAKVAPNLVEGMVGVIPNTNPQSAQFADFTRIFQASTNTSATPPDYASTAFDAGILMALAIQKAGAVDDPTKIRDALVSVSRGYPTGGTKGAAKLIGPGNIADAYSTIAAGGAIDYFGASGPVDFDDNGDVAGNYSKWLVQNGQFVTVGKYVSDDLSALPTVTF